MDKERGHMLIPFVDLYAQYQEIEVDINYAIKEVIEGSHFIGGDKVLEFEKNYANYLSVKNCIGVGNGTDALFIALKCLGIGAGDEVITAANSFVATAEAIKLTGAEVVFVDCCPRTYNMNFEGIENKINNRTKAIIPVHLYGQPVEINKLQEISKRYNLFVIEDAAQAHGAHYQGKCVGSFGVCGCFSFYPGKNLGAYGDAGAIVTNDDELAEKIRMFANHGRMKKFNHQFVGVNSRLDGLQAAILNVKLKYLDGWILRRREIAQAYNENLKEFLTVPEVFPHLTHSYHLYVVQVKAREMLRESLLQKGISTGIHYPIPLPFLDAFAYLKHKKSDFPIAYSLKDNILSLPIHGNLADSQVEYIINQLKVAIKKNE